MNVARFLDGGWLVMEKKMNVNYQSNINPKQYCEKKLVQCKFLIKEKKYYKKFKLIVKWKFLVQKVKSLDK